MLNPNTSSIHLHSEDYLRYSKQIVLNNIGIEGQKRLKDSKVLIIGAGGLSCPIMTQLVGSGIGHLGVIDSDIVEISNLNRQTLYNEMYIDELKVSSAKKELSKINTNCKIIIHKYKLDRKNIEEIIPYYDIIVDTTDNFKTRYELDKICIKLSKLLVYGAVDSFSGQLTIFNYKDGIKYKDIYKKNSYLENTSCDTIGTMGITTFHIGTLQSAEIIKIITGHKNKLDNSIIVCNLIDIKVEVKKIYREKYRDDNKRAQKTHENRYKTRLRGKNRLNGIMGKKPLTIDIRTITEFRNKHINKSVNIPLESLRKQKTVNFIQKKNKNICIYCSTLSRSLIASRILKSKWIEHVIINKGNK